MASTIKVEKKIEMPERWHTNGRKPVYPWESMKVGDSFLFPETVAPSAARSVVHYRNAVGTAKFATRKTEDGYRCWRIS